MKRVILAVCILLVVLSLGIWEQVFIVQSFDNLAKSLEPISLYLENGEFSAALGETNVLINKWRKKEDVLELISPHNEIKDVVIQISELLGDIESEQYDVAESRITVLKEYATNRKELLSFSWMNII